MKPSTATFLAAVAGASVLTLDILGVRILAPVYGLTLFPWSVLIGVTLAALALGFRLGGRLADHESGPDRLWLLPALAGVWVLLIPFIARPLLETTVALGFRWAVLIGTAVLFFPPLLLLGMVAPGAIRLRARSLEEVGRAAGDLLAAAALTGLPAALLAGFVLVPRLGVRRTTFLVGVALLAAAGIARLSNRKTRLPGTIILLLLLPVTAALWKPLAERPDFQDGLTAIRQSAWGELRVEDTGDMRSLVIDGAVRGRVMPGNWQSTSASGPAIDLARNILREPGRALVLGFGTGAVAGSFAREGWRVDAVEPDPAVVELARRYFGFRSGSVRIRLDDPRLFLSAAADRYDLIVLDARGSGPLPFHLLTREAVDLMAAHLDPRGMLVVNARVVGWEDPLVCSMAAMLRLRFREVTALPTAEPPDAVGDVVLLAADRPLEFPEEDLGDPAEFLPDQYMHWAVVQRNHAWDNRYSPGARGARILTDDRSPAGLWAERINLASRRERRENPLGVELGWW